MRILLSLGNIRFMVDVCEGFMVFTISYCAHEVYTRPSGWPPPVRIASSINQIRHVNLRRWLPYYGLPLYSEIHTWAFVRMFFYHFIYIRKIGEFRKLWNEYWGVDYNELWSDEAIHCKITLLICGLFIAGSTWPNILLWITAVAPPVATLGS